MQAKITKFESEKPLNPFSPVYKYYILESEPLDLEYMKFLEEYILKVEPEIIENFPPYSDGYTELGPESLTSRWTSYNFFKCEEFSYLKQNILMLTKTLLEFTGNKNFNEPLYGQCWGNVMRGGQQIVKHQHSTDAHSFLSGHLVVKANGSHTYYCNRYYTDDEYVSQNDVGKITLFPSYIEHGTSKVEDGIRITVAFDILTEQSQLQHVANQLEKYQEEHWVKL